MPTILVRLATPADLTSLSSLILNSFLEYKSLYTAEGFAATTPSADQLATRLTEGPIWIAITDCEILGTVSVVSRGDDLYIRGMAVAPAARGRRLGKLLLKRVEDYAVTMKHKRLILSTTPFLMRAIRLYEQAGFSRSDEGPAHLFKTPLFTMVKVVMT